MKKSEAYRRVIEVLRERDLTESELSYQVYGKGKDKTDINVILREMSDVYIRRYKYPNDRDYYCTLINNVIPTGAMNASVSTDGRTYMVIKDYVRSHPGCTLNDINNNVCTNRDYVIILVSQGELSVSKGESLVSKADYLDNVDALIKENYRYYIVEQ